jgi:hypothetical protein
LILAVATCLWPLRRGYSCVFLMTKGARPGKMGA